MKNKIQNTIISKIKSIENFSRNMWALHGSYNIIRHSYASNTGMHANSNQKQMCREQIFVMNYNLQWIPTESARNLQVSAFYIRYSLCKFISNFCEFFANIILINSLFRLLHETNIIKKETFSFNWILHLVVTILFCKSGLVEGQKKCFLCLAAQIFKYYSYPIYYIDWLTYIISRIWYKDPGDHQVPRVPNIKNRSYS